MRGFAQSAIFVFAKFGYFWQNTLIFTLIDFGFYGFIGL